MDMSREGNLCDTEMCRLSENISESMAVDNFNLSVKTDTVPKLLPTLNLLINYQSLKPKSYC